jgi:hypothetical protein
MVFNRTIRVGKGTLLGVDIPPLKENVFSAIDYEELHNRLGHPHDATLKATANKLNLKFSGNPKPCIQCAEAKLRMKNIPKEATHVQAQDIGIRIFFDISSVQEPSQAGNQFWLLIMDEYTKYCWSFFLKYKSDLSNTMICWM